MLLINIIVTIPIQIRTHCGVILLDWSSFSLQIKFAFMNEAYSVIVTNVFSYFHAFAPC